jgi:hypothetical protein
MGPRQSAAVTLSNVRLNDDSIGKPLQGATGFHLGGSCLLSPVLGLVVNVQGFNGLARDPVQYRVGVWQTHKLAGGF